MSKEDETVAARCNVEHFKEPKSDTTSSHSEELDNDATLETDRGKRFNFLLKQAEIFSYFMLSAPAKESSPPKVKGKPQKGGDRGEKQPAASTSSDQYHRHRKTEQDQPPIPIPVLWY
ncbi:chromatin-remodeling complex ATPase chain Iswi-like [Armigeres subalbatus]|uniref:chromatin-remodeling complex ATPase chain Iswi-like n=1 Tax=Armigeres subalbatus TaxID=124917 RepID=UPI002ED13970